MLDVETSKVCLQNNQINAPALIGQSAMVYCAGKLIIDSSELFVNHSPAVRNLRILLVF